MGVRERRAWAEQVNSRLRDIDLRPQRIVVLAGRRYREHLMPTLEALSAEVVVPMEGLGIGQQLAWLKEHT
jgi:hypothetical protein